MKEQNEEKDKNNEIASHLPKSDILGSQNTFEINMSKTLQI